MASRKLTYDLKSALEVGYIPMCPKKESLVTKADSVIRLP
jgi:hypothetical protein